MNAPTPTCDRKTKFHSGQKNTFGLMPGPIDCGGTCPGCTTTTDGGCWAIPKGRKLHNCYVDKIMSAYPGVRRVLEGNTTLIVGANRTAMAGVIENEIARFAKAEGRREKPALYYRLHWAGDFFSCDYAAAWADVMRKYPEVRFWGYTRTFPCVPEFKGVDNFSLYLSLDKSNIDVGLEFYNTYKTDMPGLKVCYMGRDKSELTDKLNEDCVACPVDSGAKPTEYGCSQCMICVRAARHVFFEL